MSQQSCSINHIRDIGSVFHERIYEIPFAPPIYQEKLNIYSINNENMQVAVKKKRINRDNYANGQVRRCGCSNIHRYNYECTCLYGYKWPARCLLVAAPEWGIPRPANASTPPIIDFTSTTVLIH